MAEGRSTYKRADQDWYVEPSWTVDLLLDAFAFEGGAYDPACGRGTIPDALAARGLPSIGTDLIDRADGRFRKRDFLTTPAVTRPTWPNIITNPPFQSAEPIVERALQEVLPGGRVAILAPLKWAASQKRHSLFTSPAMESLVVLSRRPSIPPGEILERDGEAARGNGSIDFAWFIFRVGKASPGATVTWCM